MALTLTSVDRGSINENGGYLLTIEGVFTIGVPVRVYIGPNGDTTDEICLSGIAGEKYDIFPIQNGTQLQCYTPILDVGGPYDIFVQNVGATEDDTLAAAITVYDREYRSSVYDIRRLFPPHWRTGPKNIEREEMIP